MKVEVILYGYATGCRSSRPRTVWQRTICDLRHDHLEELRDLFVQPVKLVREAGLVKPGLLVTHHLQQIPGDEL